jgi:hypothetical protein
MTTRHTTCVLCAAPLLPHEAARAPHCSRPACAGSYARIPANQKCSACGRPLKAGDIAGGFCASAECRRAVVTEHCRKALKEREEDKARRLALAETFRPATAAALGVEEPYRYPLAVIPGIVPRMVELPDERREALKRHLYESLAGLEGPPVEFETDTPAAELPARLAAVLGQACGLCMGKCCGKGGNAAYLWAPTMRRYRAAHPDKTADDVVADYLGKLASPTVEGSCIYHQSTGCGLTREMRSETCNRHFCQGLKDFRATAQDMEDVRGFFVSLRDGVVGPAAFIDEAGSRVVPEPAAGITAG